MVVIWGTIFSASPLDLMPKYIVVAKDKSATIRSASFTGSSLNFCISDPFSPFLISSPAIFLRSSRCFALHYKPHPVDAVGVI